MKINMLKGKDFIKNRHLKLVNIAFSGILAVSLLSSCKAKEYEDIKYEVGTHNIAEVKRDINFKWGNEGTFAIIPPEGYKIVDYNYDMFDNLQFQDFLYTNQEAVIVTNPNEFGTPLNKQQKTKNDSLSPGNHTIVEINRHISVFGQEETKELKAPNGYRLIDYDYSKTDAFEFETITYTNDETVKIDDINRFGTTTRKEETDSKYRKPGNHTIVEIKRNLTIFGKEEKRRLIAPPGYKIIDYDYDKNGYFEFETIVYENTALVEIDDSNKIGTPITRLEKSEDGILNEGEHVLVELIRNIDLLWGWEGKEYQESKEGYEILDYDYGKSDTFEFITKVYINNTKVKVTDENDFGTVVTNQKTLTN